VALITFFGRPDDGGPVSRTPGIFTGLLPQDLIFGIEHLTPEEAMKVAKFLAAVIGKAHARQMDVKTRQAWQSTLASHRSKQIDAPSWLWSSVVELVVCQEGAHLEHCRKHSLNSQIELESNRQNNSPLSETK